MDQFTQNIDTSRIPPPSPLLRQYTFDISEHMLNKYSDDPIVNEYMNYIYDRHCLEKSEHDLHDAIELVEYTRKIVDIFDKSVRSSAIKLKKMIDVFNSSHPDANLSFGTTSDDAKKFIEQYSKLESDKPV